MGRDANGSHGWLEHRGLTSEEKQPGAFGNTWICFQADFSTSGPAKHEEGQLHHLLRAHICSRHREGLTPAKSSWFHSYCSGFIHQELVSAAQRLSQGAATPIRWQLSIKSPKFTQLVNPLWRKRGILHGGFGKVRDVSWLVWSSHELQVWLNWHWGSV